ncbi:MAG: potassium/proton antiporter [Pseudomonadales bacterium]|nr:potassium/proton antiporter [Pseudomonadales bacterium]
MDTTFLLIGAILIMAGILVSPLSTRIGMPVLLLFLGVGMLAGEDGPGRIGFDDVSTAFVVANLALAIILLDGGMRTRVESFRVGLRPALLLATLGVVITALICGLAAMWLLDLPLLVGLLIGAIISSTDASAVFSLLQGSGLNLNERVEATLEIESGSNDPMAVFLTLMIIQLLQDAGNNSLWSAPLMLVQQLGLGTLTGLASGFLLTKLLAKVVLVPAMYPLLVVSSGIVLFSGTNLLGGSGFLAIYLMGIVLAANKNPRMPAILQIHDGLSWLAQLVLFLLLGLLVDPSQLLVSLPAALLIALVLIFVARPLATLVSLSPFGFSRREHLFISWVGLRGAVPIVLALFPLMAGLPDAGTIFQITFVVVLVSLLLQGSTLAALARKLKLEIPGRPEPKLRIALDAPEAGSHELLLFPLKGERWKNAVEIIDLHLPAPSRIVMFFRNGQMFERRRGLYVQEHDVIAVFAHRDQAGDIGQILGWEEPPARLTDHRFFGEFTVNGQATIGDIQANYGIHGLRFEPALTLSQCFVQVFHGHPVIGDRLDLGSMLLVVRDVQGDRVTQVGLKLSREL